MLSYNIIRWAFIIAHKNKTCFPTQGYTCNWGSIVSVYTCTCWKGRGNGGNTCLTTIERIRVSTSLNIFIRSFHNVRLDSRVPLSLQTVVIHSVRIRRSVFTTQRTEVRSRSYCHWEVKTNLLPRMDMYLV